MRYFSYAAPAGEDGDTVVTMSEEEIRKAYYPYWLGRMEEKYGVEYVAKTYSFEDCLNDWIVINWAWESTP